MVFERIICSHEKKNSIGEISSGNSAHHLTSLENHNALYWRKDLTLYNPMFVIIRDKLMSLKKEMIKKLYVAVMECIVQNDDYS